MLNEFKGFALLFLTVVMIGTIYIFLNNEDKNAYSDNLYTKEVHNEIMAVEHETNSPDDILEEKMLTAEEHTGDLKTVTMME